MTFNVRIGTSKWMHDPNLIKLASARVVSFANFGFICNAQMIR